MTEETRNSLKITPRLILGLAVLTMGVLFTLDNLEMVDAGALWDYWPIVFVVFGLAKLAEAQRGGSWVGGSAFVLLGGLWIAYNIEVIDIHPFDLWPLLLIVGGLHLVRRAMSPERKRSKSGTDNQSAFAFCSGVSRSIGNKDFKRGDYTAVMGGCEIDLREAAINGEASIDVFAFWGGVDIKVPKSFTVEPKVTCILGGLSDKTDASQSDPNQILVVNGMVMMGGVDIKN